MGATHSQPEAADANVKTVRVSPGRRILMGEHLHTVMGAIPQPWLLRQQDVDAASGSSVITVKISPGERLLMEGHFYLLMGTDDQPRLVHQGVDPASKRADHKFHGMECEARGF
jgi:hypothetical protein